jgi:hypothetical protein
MGQQLTTVEPQSQLPSTPHVPEALQPFVDGHNYGFDSSGYMRREWWYPSTVPLFVKEQLPTLIADHAQGLQPATPEFIVLELTRLAAHYPQNRTALQWQFVYEDMLDDLADTPPDIMRQAIREHRRTSVFFPKTSELLAIIEPLMGKRTWNLKRMQDLLALPTPEEKATAPAQEPQS